MIYIMNTFSIWRNQEWNFTKFIIYIGLHFLYFDHCSYTGQSGIVNDLFPPVREDQLNSFNNSN